MGGIDKESIVLLGVVSLASAYQLASFARRVGNARRKYKVEPPETTGDPVFLRHFRAQQNCLEFYPIFMVLLWVSGIFFHQVFASVVGIYYLYARQQYFSAYVEDAQKRREPFHRSVRAFKAFLLLSLLGLTNSMLKYLLDIDLKAKLGKAVGIEF